MPPVEVSITLDESVQLTEQGEASLDDGFRMQPSGDHGGIGKCDRGQYQKAARQVPVFVELLPHAT